MGRAPCCEKVGLKRGPWSSEEDQILTKFIQLNGHSNWRALPKKAGLLRCGKSCRLRSTNYLRPGIKRGDFTHDEEETIIKLHELLGNRWSIMAAKLPGRTDNEIKNIWHSRLKRRLTPNQILKHQDKLKKNIRFRNQLPPCSAIKSNGKKNNIDNCTKNNNDDNDNTRLEELAFQKDLLEKLLLEAELFENDWNLEKDFETIKRSQSPQEFDIPLNGEEINGCSSSDKNDIMDFWKRILMSDGELPELLIYCPPNHDILTPSMHA